MNLCASFRVKAVGLALLAGLIACDKDKKKGSSLGLPAIKSHLVRWGGVFASNSPFRRRVVVKREGATLVPLAPPGTYGFVGKNHNNIRQVEGEKP